MKMIAGAAFLACSKRSRTRDAPTPTIISMNSAALAVKNAASASPAMARASSVLPVPGGPDNRTPFGMRAPSALYFSGFLRKSTISFSSSSASSMPATSSKVVRSWLASWSTRLALERPKPPMPAAPPADAFRMM